ncbi:MAG: TraB/VirB10 family protein [Alphaproteobacteria bacterium]|nr:TraB/VirB10 family protein [Alphaproteobacteria bacterium]
MENAPIASVIAKFRKSAQTVRVYAAIAALILIVVGLGVVITHQSPVAVKKAKSYKAPVTSGASRLNSKEVWAEKFTNDLSIQTQRLDAMQKSLDLLLKINQQRPKIAPQTHAPSQQVVPQGMGGDLPALRDEIRQVHESVSAGQDFVQQGGGDGHPQAQATVAATKTPVQPKRFRSKGIQRLTVALANAKRNKALKTVDNTIPAGAFAGAVMVGGVDASTSIQASSDPRPVLLRVTDPGTLPRKFKSDLCGCHVLAACYGDISSERVYMRLEKLTCTERKSGELVEMNVNGYVAGEDGRAGLRGVVVDRAGESMRNAAVGGFLSGMGGFLSQSRSPITFSPSNGLAETNPMTNPEILKFGAAKGASNALEKYADFYIKRAEQMQPVIQIQAGRKVDIVFTQGVAFEDSAARGAMIKVNDQQRLSQIHDTSEPSQKPVEAWVPNQGGENK